jgi:hypothetical protein
MPTPLMARKRGPTAVLARRMHLAVSYWPVGPLVDVGGMVALPLAIRFAKLFLAHQRSRLVILLIGVFES